MAGEKPIVVQRIAPATPVLIVAPQKSKPLETKPAVIVANPPSIVVTANAANATVTTVAVPVVVVPDDSTPAPTMPAETAPAAVALPTIVTPDVSITGKVVAYNSSGRFVVLSFPAGPMPGQNQNLFLYRGGLKVGQIKVTGPQSDNNTVADVVNGDAQVGDEVRDQ